MVKKAVRTILLGIIGVSVVGLAALWVGASIWPGLFTYLQERKAAYEAFFLVSGGISVVITLALLLLDKTAPPPARAETELLKPVTLEEVHKSILPHDQDYPYYNRGIVPDDDLRGGRVFILRGGMKCGKNAEAEQVIRRLIDLGRANPERLYDISGWRREIGADPQSYLGQRLSNPRSLLFLEQIPHPCSEKDIEWLDAFAEAARRHDGFLVTTLRGDLLALDGRLGGWLQRQQGQAATVVGECARPMTETDTGRLIDWLSFTYHVEITPSGRDLLVRKADRAYPYHLITMFQEYRRQGLAKVADDQLGADVQKSLAQLWAGIRTGLLEQQPAIGPLLAALAEFQAAGVRPFTELVFRRALRVGWPGKSFGLPDGRRAALRSAANSLAQYGVTREERFHVPESVLPPIPAPEQALPMLADFLRGPRLLWENRPVIVTAQWVGRLLKLVAVFALFWMAVGPLSVVLNAREFFSHWVDHIEINYILWGTLLILWLLKIMADLFITRDLHTILLARAMTWFDIGFRHQAQNQTVDAITAYEQALALEPGLPYAWNNLGTLLAEQPERAEEAEAAYRQALAIDPRKADTWNNLGELLTHQPNKAAEAEEAYRRGLAIDLHSVAAWYGLGYLMAHQPGRVEEAEAAYRQALAIDPRDAAAWNDLGYLLAKQPKRAEEAEAAVRQALAIDPQNANIHDSLGFALAQQPGREGEVESAYRKALEIDTHLAETWTNLGDLLKALGRLDEAEEAYRRAANVPPSTGA